MQYASNYSGTKLLSKLFNFVMDSVLTCVFPFSRSWDDDFICLNSIYIDVDCLSSVDVTYGAWKRKQDFEKILVV